MCGENNGYFPNMPQKAILEATKVIIEREEKNGKKGVWVPRDGDRPCAWEKPRRKENGTWLPWVVIQEVIKFALNNSLIKKPDGSIWKQQEGIPMGGPVSPGMTIATCAWMEENWLKELPIETKQRFDAIRYMDDIFMAYDTSDRWDSNKLIDDICESKCYWNPLTLEDGRQGVFLKIEYEQKKGSIYGWHIFGALH